MELTKQELHFIGMNFIGEKLKDLGYEFLGVNSDLKRDPQFVIYKNEEPITFVIVETKPAYKDYGIRPKNTNRVIEHAIKQNAKVWFAGIGIENVNNPSLPPTQNEDYNIYFTGFKILTA